MEHDPAYEAKIEGYGLYHGERATYGGPDKGGWIENISRTALEAAVAAKPRLPLRAGEGGPVIGYADLTVDDVGLKINGTVVSTVSFRVKQQRWGDNFDHRDIDEISIADLSVRTEKDIKDWRDAGCE